MTYGHALISEPLHLGSWNLKLGWPFLGHSYFILSLSDLCLGVKKKIFKGIMLAHYMTYGHAPRTRTPAPGVMECTNLVDPSLVITTIHFVCLNHAPELRRRFFMKYINFTIFNPKLSPLRVGSWNLHKCLSPYSTTAAYHIWLKLPYKFWRERGKPRMNNPNQSQLFTKNRFLKNWYLH